MDPNKEEHNVNYKKINLQKLNIVTHGNFDNELLGGMVATGLLAQIFDGGGKEYLTPKCTFVISVKTKNYPPNFHVDDWGEGRLKVLGILNSDWNSEKDGGGFICDGVGFYKLKKQIF